MAVFAISLLSFGPPAANPECDYNTAVVTDDMSRSDALAAFTTGPTALFASRAASLVAQSHRSTRHLLNAIPEQTIDYASSYYDEEQDSREWSNGTMVTLFVALGLISFGLGALFWVEFVRGRLARRLGHEYGHPKAWLTTCAILVTIYLMLFGGLFTLALGAMGLVSGAVNIACGGVIIYFLRYQPDSVDRAARVLGTAADTMRREVGLVRGYLGVLAAALGLLLLDGGIIALLWLLPSNAGPSAADVLGSSDVSCTITSTEPYATTGMILRAIATVLLVVNAIITVIVLHAGYTAAVGRFLSQPRAEGVQLRFRSAFSAVVTERLGSLLFACFLIFVVNIVLGVVESIPVLGLVVQPLGTFLNLVLGLAVVLLGLHPVVVSSYKPTTDRVVGSMALVVGWARERWTDYAAVLFGTCFVLYCVGCLLVLVVVL